MATALDLISSALRLINVVEAGEQTPIDTANDALMVLNDMIDSWNTDRLSIFTTRIDTFPFILGQQDYTLGTGGDFDMPRPAQIDAMSSILLTNPDNPVEVPIAMLTVDQWQTQVPVKKVDGTFPLQVYDDGGFPLRKLSFWPIPSQQPSSARIYSWQGLNQPATLATVIAFPPGYPEAFRYNLAIRLSAEFQATVLPQVQQIASESLARLKTINAPDLNLQSDLMPWPAGYNYRADLFGIAW